MSAVSVSESGVRPILADAVELARGALLELEPSAVGVHLGVTAEDDSAATHRFETTLPGYRGWQWEVVVAAPPGAETATVSESALLPGPDALVAPDFVPWDQRIRPGDLAPGDLLAPIPDDPRLVPGYVASGDPAVDEAALEIGLGRSRVLSLEGREEAAQRWYTDFGPDTEMAKAAPSTCGLCGFYLPVAGAMRAAFGVCGNSMGADGHVVHSEYGCGAHSDTVVPTGGGSPLYEAYDDAAIEMIPAELLRKEEVAPEVEEVAPEAEADVTIETAAISDPPAESVISRPADAVESTVAEPGSDESADSASDSTAVAAVVASATPFADSATAAVDAATAASDESATDSVSSVAGSLRDAESSGWTVSSVAVAPRAAVSSDSAVVSDDAASSGDAVRSDAAEPDVTELDTASAETAAGQAGSDDVSGTDDGDEPGSAARAEFESSPRS